MGLARLFLGLIIVASVAAFVYVAANGTDHEYRIGSGTGAFALTGLSALMLVGVVFIGALILFAILGNRR